jgi:hypothetical protein
MDKWIDGNTDAWMHGYIGRCPSLENSGSFSEQDYIDSIRWVCIDKQLDRYTNKQTNNQASKQARHTNTQTNEQTNTNKQTNENKQTNIHTYKHTYKHTNMCRIWISLILVNIYIDI